MAFESKVLLNKFQHHAIQMMLSDRSGYCMLFVGIEKRLEILARSDKRVLQHNGILDMDIIVPRAMNEQELSLELVSISRGGVHVIPFWI